jgi:methyl-accepting chemotaxis protein
VELNQRGAAAASLLGDEIYATARTVTISLLVLSVLLGVFCAVAITRAIATPLRAMTQHMQRVAVGDIDQRVELRSKDEVGELAESLRQIIASQQTLAQGATRLAAGDISVETTLRSDKDEVGRSFVALRDTMQGLVAEMGLLTEAARDGRLATRGDAEKFKGAFRTLVTGVNDTLEAVIRPVNESAGILERLADRDLTVRVTGDYKGDHAKIKVSINAAAAALQSAMAEVAATSGQVASASQEIASGSQQLAEGSSEQAASLEEVSSSLQELASMTQQNTGNAREARGLVESARTSVDHGVQGITRLSGAMDQIKASSDSTARIVKTIDEIAFQTNLLALNAAVEAARAGDSGKGFAVVAEEVRNLAMRSADAAKQTAALIEESVRNAGQGVALSQEVVTHLSEIHQRVDKVSEVMAEIAAASDQQHLGVAQISTAVEQMNAVTQQVAASSEESASAAVELSSQSARMRELVEQFRLGDQGGFAQSAAPRSPVRSHSALSMARGATQRGAARSGGRLGKAAPWSAPAGAGAGHSIPFDDDSVAGDF